MQQTQSDTENTERTTDEAPKQMKPLARLHLLYESKDHRMCLFEDAQGHLVSVPSSKLA